MSLIYKCDLYGTTTNNAGQYPHKRTVTIDGNQINGIDAELLLNLEIVIPAAGGERVHVSVPAWKDAAQILKAWLDATFP